MLETILNHVISPCLDVVSCLFRDDYT